MFILGAEHRQPLRTRNFRLVPQKIDLIGSDWNIKVAYFYIQDVATNLLKGKHDSVVLVVITYQRYNFWRLSLEVGRKVTLAPAITGPQVNLIF